MSTAVGTVTTSQRPWWEWMTDLCYAAMFIFACTPETVIGKPYIGPAPLYFVVFYLGLFASTIELMVSKKRLPPLMALMIGVWIVLLLHGALRGNELKWIAIDASSLMGCIAGYHWISRRSMGQLLYQWHRLAAVITLLFALTLIGLASGFVKPAIESGRIYVYSVFRAAGFLTIVMPILWAAKRYFPIPRAPYWMFSFPFLFVLLLITIAAYYTATRSMLLEGFVCLLFICAIATYRVRGLSLFLVSLLLLMAVTAWDLNLIPSVDLGALGERLRQTGSLEESRYQELMMMLKQMSGYDYLFGMGMGSRFQSVVMVDGTDLALNPHIVIFTYLQKGGLLFFFLTIIFPALVLLFRLLTTVRASEIELGALAGGLMYLLMASISGGWEFYFTFLYGAMLGIGAQAQWRKELV